VKARMKAANVSKIYLKEPEIDLKTVINHRHIPFKPRKQRMRRRIL